MKISLELQPILKSKSGIGWYTYEIIKRLDKRKLELRGCIFNFLNKNNIKDFINIYNFEKELCSSMPYGIYRRLWNYLPIKYNNLFKTKADIYHFFNFIAPPKIDGKVIVTIYDMVYKLFPETMSKANYNSLHKNLIRSAGRADKIITISQNSKIEIIKFLNINPDKIEIVSPGVDIEIFSQMYTNSEKKKIIDKYKLPDKFMLYLGTLEPRKNIEAIVDCYALYKKHNISDLKLVIAGQKGWMYESIFEKVKKYNLENEVIFTGYVDELDKTIIYQLSRIFIFPSFYEGFGMPVLEAMASGVPVIASNTSSLPEVCGQGAIQVEPKDIEAMCRAIYILENNFEFKNNLIQEGFRQCRKFNWDASVDKLVGIYNELMESQS